MIETISLYFPNRKNEEELISLVSLWIDFFANKQQKLLHKKNIVVEPDFEVYIDYKSLCKSLPSRPPSLNVFKEEFVNSPEHFLVIFSCAVHFVLSGKTKNETICSNDRLMSSQLNRASKSIFGEDKNDFTYSDDELFQKEKKLVKNKRLLHQKKEKKVKTLEVEEDELYQYASILNDKYTKLLVRIYNYYPLCLIKDLRSTHVGKFVCFTGTTLQTNSVKPQVLELRFNCFKCGSEILQKFDDGRYSVPPCCINEKCRGRFFIPQKKTAVTKDAQKIRVQEDNVILDPMQHGDSSENKIFDDTNFLTNRKLAVIDCELLGSNIVEKCVVGEKVKICGILKTQIIKNLNDFSKKIIHVDGGNFSNTKSIFVFYVSVTSIVNLTKMEFSPYLQLGDEYRTNSFWKDFQKERRKIKLKVRLKKEMQNKKLKADKLNHKIKQEKEQEEKESEEEEKESEEEEKESEEEEKQVVIDLDEVIDIDNNFSIHNNNINKKNNEGKKYSNSNLMKKAILFTQNELSFIFDIFHNEEQKFYLFAASLVPNILGKNIIKSGLALCLLGGVPIFDDNNNLRRRGDIHAILIGDSGLGKSEILRMIREKSERGIYVCGNTTSRSGLTATVLRDPQTNDFALQGGALVLADGGVCCIDELDKMSPHEQQTFLEAMEQQSISVAKAGILCSLSARTTIIAAANPKDGKYDKSKGFFENIKMSSPLVSRFDLIFVMSDNADPNFDTELSKHVMQIRGGSSSSLELPSSSLNSFSKKTQKSYCDKLSSLAEKCAAQKRGDLLPTKLIHAYIRYARTYIQPKLTKDAAEEIKIFYLKLREEKSKNKNLNEIYPTTRQLEAIIRLSQARARGDLSEKVTRNHVLEVIEIYMHTAVCAFDSQAEGYGTKKRTFRAKSASSLANCLKDTLERLALQFNGEISKSDALECAQKVVQAAGIYNIQATQLIEILNNEGVIINKGNFWKTTSMFM